MRKVGMFLNGNNPLEISSSLDSFHFENLSALAAAHGVLKQLGPSLTSSFVTWNRKALYERIPTTGSSPIGDDLELWRGPRHFTLGELFEVGLVSALGAAAAARRDTATDRDRLLSLDHDPPKSSLNSPAVAEFAAGLRPRRRSGNMLLMSGHGDGPLRNLMVYPVALDDARLEFFVAEFDGFKHLPRLPATLDLSPNWLSNSELLSGLKRAGFSSRHKLEVLGFDACQQGTIESAFELSPSVSYLVASELNIPLNGWDYVEFLKVYLGQGSPAFRAKKLVEAYRRKYVSEAAVPLTMVAVSLRDLSKISEPLRTFTSEMLRNQTYRSKFREIAASLATIPDRDFRKVDFRTLFARVASSGAFAGASSRAAQAILCFFDKSVRGRMWRNQAARSEFECTGLSITLPVSRSDFTDDFKRQYLDDTEELTTFRTQTRWHELLTALLLET